jgi:hypothetical protein
MRARTRGSREVGPTGCATVASKRGISFLGSPRALRRDAEEEEAPPTRTPPLRLRLRVRTSHRAVDARAACTPPPHVTVRVHIKQVVWWPLVIGGRSPSTLASQSPERGRSRGGDLEASEQAGRHGGYQLGRQVGTPPLGNLLLSGSRGRGVDPEMRNFLVLRISGTLVLGRIVGLFLSSVIVPYFLFFRVY